MLSGQRKGITKTTLGGRRAMIMAALAVAGWLSIPPSAAHATTGAAGGAGQNGTYSTGGVVGTGGVGGTGTGSGSYANAGGNGGYNAAGTAGEGANSSGGGGGTFSGTGALGGVASGGGGAGGYATGTNSGSADGGVGGGSTTHGFGGGGGGGASLPSNALGGPGGGGGGGGGGSAAVSGISTGTYTPVFNITGGDGGNGGYHGVVGIGTIPTTSPITAGPNPTPGTLKLDVSVAKFAENSTITLTGSPVYYSGGGGGGGGAGIFTGATAIAITNNSTLTITGGAGGNGGYLGGGGGGGGGGGVVGSNFTLTNFGVVSGGGGGGGIPGAGGTGVSGSGFTLINHGTITGGAAATAGVGGIGVSGRGFTIANSGTIIGAAGGVGGSGGNGGNGGTGAHSTGSSIVTNDGTISGGTGGSGTIGVSTGGYGGNGGTGAYWSSSAMITNNGVISGGAGGTSGTIAGSGGSGIQGMRFTLTNNNEITGGAKGIGGGGQLGGNGGAGVMATGFTLNNNGKIAGGTGGSSGFGGAGVSGGGFTLTNNGTISGNTGYGGGGDGVEGFLTGGFTLFNSGIITGGAHFFIANGGSGVDCSTGGATITNAGSISGGLSGGSTTNYADAIDLFGGGNTLILESGYSFTGNVVSTRGTTAGDSLELGGTSSAAFDVSNVDASISGSYTGTPQYVGFANLSVVGTATWTVTGTNNSGLGWDLNGGTLAISSASTLGSSAVTLDGGTLDYTGTAAVAVSNAVVNTGAVSILENSGSGTESLTGSIANATAGNILAFSGGTFNLNEAGSGAGTFEIGDAPSTVIVSNANAFGSGAIIVNSGSTLETSDALAGSGSVLAITGSSYTQNSGSTLKLLATGNGINDSIQLGSGTASLNGELNLIFSGFTPAAGQHYTVIGTTGTVSGTFSSLVLTGAPSLLKGTANYIAGTGEVIDLSNLAYFANLSGFTPNQASVATYLNNNAVSSSTPGTIQNAMVALSSMSQQQQANYLNELTPQAYYDLPQQSIQNNTFMAQQVFNQVQNSFDGGGFNTSGLMMLKTNDQDPFAVSMDAALASAQQQAQNSVAYMDNSPQMVGMPGVGPIVPSQESPLSNLSGFVLGTITVDQLQQNNTPTQHFTTGSVMAGLDYRLNRNLVIGGLFNWGYTGGTMDNVGSRQRSSSYTPGVFVGYKQGGFYADGLMSYTYNSYQINRSVNMPGSSSIATGEPDSNEYDANALVGYYLPLARGFQAGPAAGVGFTQMNIGGFHETGSPFDLTVAKQHADSLRSLLGMQALYSFAPENNPLPISINFNAFWQHEFLDSSRDINAGFTQLGGGNFIYNTAGPSRDSALLGLGASGYINQQISLFVNYETQVGDHRQFAQTVMAGVAVSF